MSKKVFGIDFGTRMIKIYKKGEGVVLDQNNVIAVADRKHVIAVGDEASEMCEKAPNNIKVTYPIKFGVVADIASMQALLNMFLAQVNKSKTKMSGADFIVAVPNDVTEVEKRAFFDLIANSNAKPKSIKIVEKPIADAVGVGLEVTTARGVMTVNIGADTTEISIMSLGGIVLSKLIPIGGNRLDESIKLLVKKKYNLVIGDKTAETIKKQLASAIPIEEEYMSVYGRNVVSGLPIETEISSSLVYEAIREHMHSIIDSIKIILERTPPEISSDIIDAGIFVTGGSAHIRNIDKLIETETELVVNVSNDPENSVVNGLGMILDNPELSSLAAPLRQTNYSM